MDQDAVGVNLSGGWRLIDSLVGHGFPIATAFWVKPSDEGKWFPYLASPTVDQEGPGAAYRLIHNVLRNAPEWGIDPFEVMAVGVGNPMAKAAREVITPKIATGPFAVPNQKPYRGMTRFGGKSLGGSWVDGAYIYPPWEPAANPVG